MEIRIVFCLCFHFLIKVHSGAAITGGISTITTAKAIESMSTIQPNTTTGPMATTQILKTSEPMSTTHPYTTIEETSATQLLTTTGLMSTTKSPITTGSKYTSTTARPSTIGRNSSGSPARQPTSAVPVARPSNLYANNSITTGDHPLNDVVGQSLSSVKVFTTRSAENIATTTTSRISTSEECEKISNVSSDTMSLSCSLPIINLTNELLEFDPSTDELIYIKGNNLLQGCLLRDYVVHIGNRICTNCNLQDNRLSCRPPKVEPSPAVNDTIFCGQHLRISITVGDKKYQYACLMYINRSRRLALIIGLTVGLGGFALLLAILIVCAVKRRRKKISLSKICVHQNSGGHELKNRVHKKTVQPKSQGDYGDMEHCYA